MKLEQILISWALVIAGFVACTFVVIPAFNNATDDLLDAVDEQFKVCLHCGSYEPKDTAACEECGGSNFALYWCDDCESVFDKDLAFCPNCGRKQ